MVLSGSVGDAGAGADVRVDGPKIDGDTGIARHVDDNAGEVAYNSVSRGGLCKNQHRREV